ncbi:hypothetical protein QJS04_geneDACA019684 [Acorus gramineus]|uniref:Uncharacterized protein n=1 Tax=Acorus gramineus TaxID=55184 RepID=A0AAV9B2J9_ACOGR|nr:hypothetical protein QJS04_geneDACA019684 [Acorus gramineus]
MQTSKARSGPPEMSRKTSPSSSRTARQLKTPGSESPTKKTPTNRSPKGIERKSPCSPVSEKKRVSRVAELESEVVQLRENLKKAKDQLSSAESWKKLAQQEADDARKQLSSLAEKLENSQHQLLEFTASEDARLQELRKLSQERDRAWQSELEAIQQQHLIDSTALSSAMNEIQRLKLQLEMVMESEGNYAKRADIAQSELQTLKLGIAATHSLLENLKIQLINTEISEAEAQALFDETQLQLEMAKETIETLHSNSLKVMDSLGLVTSELEESREHIISLEESLRELQAENELLAGQKASIESVNHKLVNSEVEELKSALETAEIRYLEEHIRNVMQTQCAYELVELTKHESSNKDAEMVVELKKAQSEISELKEKVTAKEIELLQNIVRPKEFRSHSRQEKELELEEKQLEEKLRQSMRDLEEVKANLMDKETELQNVAEENEQLRLETKRMGEEIHKGNEVAAAEVEVTRAAEQEALMRLGFVTEEADKNSRMVAQVSEQLEAVQTANSEMVAELRRIKVQSEQWRKAAEAAAAVLTTSNNNSNGKLMERTGSMDSAYRPFDGKTTILGSPYSEGFDDDSPKKKNNMLKKIGVLWKKGQK